MDLQLFDILNQGARTLLLAMLPTLAITLAAFLFSILQGMMAIREESMLYAVRAVALVLVIVAFGTTVAASCTELMRLALR